jgi:HEPN domain-containing protein
MTPRIDEARLFLRLANDDRDAFHVLKTTPHIKLRVLCFHAQQAVEKSLKAVMLLQEIPFRKTHDLNLLANLIAESGLSLPRSPEDLTNLNPHAVTFRYDDIEIDTLTREEAEAMMESIMRWATGLVPQE